MLKGMLNTNRGAAVLLTAALFAMAASGSACGTGNAASAQQDTIAAGGVTLATDTGAPCTDLGCNAGDICDCITGSGAPNHLDSRSLPVGSIAYELSVDESAVANDGSAGGKCMPSTGKGVITLRDKSTIDFVMAGTDCTVPEVGQELFNGTIQLSGGTAQGGGIHGLGSVQLTNFLGQNTPVIAGNEAQYLQMWAVDVAEMVGYGGVANGN
jgi:PPE-repeat protein